MRGNASGSSRRRTLLALAVLPLTWPAVAASKRPVIGVLWHAGTSAEETRPRRYLLEGFAALGYVEGRDMVLEERFPNEVPELFDRYAAELVALGVDVLIGPSVPSALALQRATTKIPIVFVGPPEPVRMKLVASLGRPGGNITGITPQTYDADAKRLQFLHEALPGASRIATLFSPANPYDGPRMRAELQPIADKFGMTLKGFEVRQPAELEAVITAIAAERFDAVFIPQSALVVNERARVAALAIAHRLPTIATIDAMTEAGALMAYGAAYAGLFRSAPALVHKILKGAKPADLPVEQPTHFELTVNLNTAHRLGIALPPSFLARADRVFETGDPAVARH